MADPSDAQALVAVQERSYRHASAAVRGSWPPEHAMEAEELAAFLTRVSLCVLATSRPDGRPQAAPVAFELRDGAFRIATMAGARLRNLRARPYAALVVSEGPQGSHRMVMAEGPVVLHEEAAEQPAWAAATIELRPEILFSYRPAPPG